MVSPASAPLPSTSTIGEATLSSAMAGPAGSGVSVDEVSLTFTPVGPVPVAVAVLARSPESTSAWVSV